MMNLGKIKVLAATITIATLGFFGVPAASQQPQMIPVYCGDAESLNKHLVTKFDEAIVFEGVTTNGKGLVALWFNPKTNTWSFVVYSPSSSGVLGVCLIATGNSGEILEEPVQPNTEQEPF